MYELTCKKWIQQEKKNAKCSTSWYTYTSDYLSNALGLKSCLSTQRHCIKAIILVHCTRNLFRCTCEFSSVQIAKYKTLFAVSKLVAVIYGGPNTENQFCCWKVPLIKWCYGY